MSVNDLGRINNPDQSERESLRNLWRSLIDKINNDNTASVENFIDSDYGKELFLAFSYDNPDVILLRYLRARKWNVHDALKQLLDTLIWRIKSNVKEIIAGGESKLSYDELLTGKTFYVGYDRDQRPVSYISVKDHIKGQFTSQQTKNLTIFYVELGRKLLRTPDKSVTIIFDMIGFSMQNMDFAHIRYLHDLLINYYPESFGLALIINASALFRWCWVLIRQWLDPVVQAKIHFIKSKDDLHKYVDPLNLPKRLDGNLPDYNYVPPTEQDQLMLSAFRSDLSGYRKAIQNHREASKNYLYLTAKWANENNNKHLLEERKEATSQLLDAYKQLVPYIATRTHYHRIQYIDEPIFDIAYRRIVEREDKA